MKKLVLLTLMLANFALLTACGGSKSQPAPAPVLAQKWGGVSVEEFVSAAYKGDTEIVRNYLAGGGDINAKRANGINALMNATYANNEGIVSYLISKGARVDDQVSYNDWGGTALMYATQIRDNTGSGFIDDELVSWGSIKISTESMKLLIEAGANLNLKNNKSQTALMYAIAENESRYKYNIEDAVKLLLQAGADPNIPDNNGDTALTIATLKEMNNIVTLLKKYNAQ